jgi:hypothetical protein
LPGHKPRAIAFLLLLLGAGRLDAQAPTPRGLETNSGPIIPFLEGTDVFFAVRKDTVFEADIFPHLVAVQNFSDVLDVQKQRLRGPAGFKQWAFSISGTPAVRIRMFESASRPVRTPSYMPRGNFQVLFARNIAGAVSTVGALQELRSTAQAQSVKRADQRPMVALWEAHAIVGHHSNGQDGCFYNEETRAGEGCSPSTPNITERSVNKTDGSFSTNYARVGINYRRNWLDAGGWAHKEWGVRFDYEQHFKMDENVRELYGRQRVEGAISAAWRDLPLCPKRLDSSGALKYIHDHPGTVWPVAVTAQLSCFPFWKGGWGFFVRYYGGQDYYNLGLLENIQRLHLGATFNQTGFFRFRRTSSPE